MPTTSYTEFVAGIREVPGRTDSSGTAVSGDLPLREDALINEVLTAGVVKPDAAFAPSKGSGDFDVDLGSGTADADLFVVESQVTGQAPYLVQLQATSITVTLDAADADARIDEVYLVVFDAGRDSNVAGLTLPRIAVRKGDSASSPSAPGPDAEWEAWALLASVAVSGGAPSISAGDVTDERASSRLTVPPPKGMETFTASGTFTVPDFVERVRVTLVGGGGGGGGTALNADHRGGSGGGGAGDTVIGTLAVTPGESLDVTVGSYGVGGDETGGDDGDDGTASSIERSGTILARAEGGDGGKAPTTVLGGSGGVGGGTAGSDAPDDGLIIGGGNGGPGTPRFTVRGEDTGAAAGGFGGVSALAAGATGRWHDSSSVGPFRSSSPGVGGAGAVLITLGERGGRGDDGVVIIEW